ncbi:MAG TPA: hypothetical protein VK943_01190, partial [Arenibaculum sp.]|nr:hypothetical protein [Arenibaculum sp.]
MKVASFSSDSAPAGAMRDLMPEWLQTLLILIYGTGTIWTILASLCGLCTATRLPNPLLGGLAVIFWPLTLLVTVS